MIADRAPRRFIACIVVLVVWGLITHGTFAGSGDDPHYLIAAQSIAFDGDVDVANNYGMPGNLIGGGHPQPEAHARRGRGGILRPVHDIGLPILFAPYVRLAYPFAQWAARVVPARVLAAARLNDMLIFRHLISLAMAALTAALAVQLFELFRRTAGADRPAIRWALLVTLSPPLLSHAFLFFTAIPSALVVTWLFRTLSSADDERPPWAVVGLATGALLFLHIANIALVLGFAVWGMVRLRRSGARASGLQWGAGLGGLLLAHVAMTRIFWGTWLTTPHAAADLSIPFDSAMREMLVRFSGLFLDQEFGLIPYAPLYLLVPAGLTLLRRHRGAGWAAGIASAYLATILLPWVNVHGWTGGWAPAGRMLTPIVPLLSLPVFVAARSITGAGHWVVTMIVVLQIAIDAVVWQWPKSLWNYADGTSSLLTSLPALQAIAPAWNAAAPSAARFACVFAGWAGLSLLLLRTGRSRAASV